MTAILSISILTGWLSNDRRENRIQTQPKTNEAKRLNELTAIITHVRRCFQLLATISDEMLADLGLTASLRAVMEHLHEHGPQTVPQIAEEKSVRRQSIQALVDQLREEGLVTTSPNPAHRRSVLVSLTREGRAVFIRIQQRERAKLRDILQDLEGQHLEGQDLDTAVRVLGALRNSLHANNNED